MNEKKYFRPAARIISTIGENLIKDKYAAIVELVKNSYDADASKCTILFYKSKGQSIIKITDNGHGMSEDTILYTWLVPSTDDKEKRKYSPNGRRMQGEKGVGRFSAAILGDILYLTTIKEKLEIKVKVDWNEFFQKKYLDEISLEVSSKKSMQNNGSEFLMIDTNNQKNWTFKDISTLKNELKKLVTPFDDVEDIFDVELEIDKTYFGEDKADVDLIKPFPILDFFEYRVSGTISKLGFANLKLEYYDFENNLHFDTIEEKIYISENAAYCGELNLDFRVYDREPKILVNSFNRSKAFSENLKVADIRNLLDKIYGISIYRNQFRIRPYGDKDYDWLELDKRRVQKPADKIGMNQISGTISIQDKEKSNLIEKSARDGIKENESYLGLKDIITNIINRIELLRKKLNTKSSNPSIRKAIESFSSASELKKEINDIFEEENVSNAVVNKIEKAIEADIKLKEELASNIVKQLSTYEGQVTLGKMVDVTLHEVRRPLNWFKNQSNNIEELYSLYLKEKSKYDFENIIQIIEDSSVHSQNIIDYFSKIDVLSARRNEKKKIVRVKGSIEKTINIFKKIIEEKNINVEIKCDESIKVNFREKELIVILSNIIDNSIYWLLEQLDKRINIYVQESNKNIQIDIEDNGTGIPLQLLENNLLFEPGVSNKPDGTGLGLSIAGNILERENGKISAGNNVLGGAFIQIEISKDSGV